MSTYADLVAALDANPEHADARVIELIRRAVWTGVLREGEEEEAVHQWLLDHLQ